MYVIAVQGTLKGERREEVTAAWRTGCGVGRVGGCGGGCSVHLHECLLLMEVMAVSELQMMSVHVMSCLLLLLLLRVVVSVRMRLLLVAVSERCGVSLSDVLLLLMQCQRVSLLRLLLLLLLWLQECTDQMLHSTPLPTATDGSGGWRVAD